MNTKKTLLNILLRTTLLLCSMSLPVLMKPDRPVDAKVSPKRTKSLSAGQAVAKEYYLYGATYSIKGPLKSTLVLNNAMNRPKIVHVTLYNRQGDEIEMPEIILTAYQVEYFDLAKWLRGANKSKFSEGSIGVEIYSDTNGVGVGAELIVSDETHHLNFDVPLAKADDFASSELQSLWWSLDDETKSRIFLANTTTADLSISPTLYLGDQMIDLDPIVLGAHQSTDLDLQETMRKLKRFPIARIGGIRLRHNNQPGALAAAGISAGKRKGFSSSLRFTDTGTQGANVLHGAHLPIGLTNAQSGFPSETKFTPYTFVRNTTDLPLNVKGKVRYTVGKISRTIDLDEITLAANEIRQIDLSLVTRLIGSKILTDTGIELEHSGRPGAMIAAAASTDQSGDQIIDVPMRDPKSRMNPGGIYPWRIDGDNRAVVHLKNVDSETDGKSHSVIAQIRYDNGEYSLPIQVAKTGQTIAIDIKKLRDEQIPDSSGKVIPLNITRGEVAWYDRSQAGQFIGRLLQYDPVEGTASSFSYATGSCCGINTVGLTLSPNDVTKAVGSTVEYTVIATFQNTCNFDTFQTDVTDDATFTSSPSSVCAFNDLNNKSQLSLLAPGDAQITAEWEGFTVEKDERFPPCMGCPPVCRNVPFQISAIGGVKVTPGVTVSINPFTAVGKDLTATVPTSLNLSAVTGSTTVTFKLSTKTGTGKAIFDSTGSDTLSLTRTGGGTTTENIKIKGVTESSTANNIRLEAKLGSTSLATRDFTVLLVTLAIRTSGVVSADNSARIAYNNCTGTFSLGRITTSGTSSCSLLTSTTDFRSIGVEIVGTVKPSDYTGQITLHRTLLKEATFVGETLVDAVNGLEDTSPSQFQDSNPSSGGSAGKIYDVDAPGIESNPLAPIHTVSRVRRNFAEFATVDSNTRVTLDFKWFNRVSIIKTSTGDGFQDDITKDNQSGAGTTLLTADLK